MSGASLLPDADAYALLGGTEPAGVETAGTAQLPPSNEENSGVRVNWPMVAWIAPAVLAAAAALYFWTVLRYAVTSLFVGAPGFSKLRKEALLDNPARNTLEAAIRAEPGITPPELQAIAGVAWSTVVYHLGVLEKNKLVSSLIDGRHKRFFPVGELDHALRGQVGVLRNDRTRTAFDYVRGHPGTGQRTLAKILNVSRPTATWHLERLERHGLVSRQRAGRRVQYAARDAPPGIAPAPLA